MSGVYPSDIPQGENDSALVGRKLTSISSNPLQFPLLFIFIVTAVRACGTVDSDVSWQLWIAERVHAGAHLYRDIIETNPPLWFWMAVPIERIAALLHLRIDLVLIVAVGGLCALSLAATAPFLWDLARPRRTLFLSYAAMLLACMPWMHVGQREQLVLIGALPYTALTAARRTGRPVSSILAACIGIGAALGFALKHYFLLVPVFLELWLITTCRDRWRPFRPETVAVVAVGFCYGVAILLWGRDFLQIAIPLLHLAYGATGAPTLLELFQARTVVGLLTLIFVAWQLVEAKEESSAVAIALIISAGAFAGAYFIQAKGWAYHSIPLLGCSALALAAALATDRPKPRAMALAAPALLLLPFALSFEEIRREPQPTADLLQAVDGLRSGDSVGFVAADPSLGWTLTLQRNFRYASRYNGFWMLRAVVADELQGQRHDHLTQLGRTVVAETALDFRCVLPRRIIVARPRESERGFDILPFFYRDPQFSALLAHYRRLERTSLDVYELADPPAPLPSRICRSGI